MELFYVCGFINILRNRKNIESYFFILVFIEEIIKEFLNCFLKMRFRSIKLKGDKEY